MTASALSALQKALRIIVLPLAVVLGMMWAWPPSSLAANGPWLVYRTIGTDEPLGLWMADANGSEKRQAAHDRVVTMAASPTGNRVAYITATRSYTEPKLYLLSLPEGTTRLITPLTSSVTEQNAELIKVVMFGEPMQWSPDGTRLAFLGAQRDAYTADLYVYSVADDRVTALDVAASIAYAPGWSPDSAIGL